MIIEKLALPLHDRSLIHVSQTDAGAIDLEVYAPGHAKDGHGYLLKGSTMLAATDIRALVALLSTTTHQKKAA